MTVGLGISAGLLLVAVTVRVCVPVAGPAVMPVRLIVCGPGVRRRAGRGWGSGRAWAAG